MNHSTPGLPVHHQLLEFTETHVQWVGDTIQLIPCLPLLLLPSIFPNIRVFSNESALSVRWSKYWSFSFNISPSNEHPELISFRMDWLDLLAVQGTLKSLLQHHSSKESILQRSAFFRVQLSHPYMTTVKTIALTGWTFVGKVMSLLFNMLSRLVMTFLPRSKCLLISWLQISFVHTLHGKQRWLRAGSLGMWLPAEISPGRFHQWCRDQKPDFSWKKACKEHVKPSASYLSPKLKGRNAQVISGRKFLEQWLCCGAQLFSRVWLLATPQTLACQAPLSMGFRRQEYWSGMPFPPPGDLLDPGIEPASPVSPALAGGFSTSVSLENGWSPNNNEPDSVPLGTSR